MRLSLLLKNIMSLPAEADCEVSRLVLDSRQVDAQDLFLAVKGTNLDGRNYIAAAMTQGAVAVLMDIDDDNEKVHWENDVPLIPIYKLQSRLGELGAQFYQNPAEHMCMIGVTGTNGKTSCTHFIAQILQSLQMKSAVIGTLGSGMYGALGEAGLTTPDAITLQATLRSVLDQGAKAVAMEVSSHSIDQGRVNGIEFAVGVFTNLTQDHLDYHGTMENYAAVKYRFLADFPIKQIVINIDDGYGAAWAQTLAATRTVFTYGVLPIEKKEKNLTYASDIQLTLHGIKAIIHSPFGEGELLLPLIGRFNLSNALAVLTTLCVLGVPFKDALFQLSQLKAVSGRMQTLGGQGQPVVVIDYAHTPDALEKALEALRPHTAGRLICVFGCGGDRDPGKRAKMATIAEKLADQVIVTNDNPRHEVPETIAEQIMCGFSHPDVVLRILDRSKAIEKSIQLATGNDCILIAGKGAEHYQQIGDNKIPFDDVEQASKYLAQYKQRA